MEKRLLYDYEEYKNRYMYTPTNFAKNRLIYLQEIGTLRAEKPLTKRRDYLSSYLFFVVLNGCGSLEYEGNSFSLVKGDCVFLDCSKPYAHTTQKELWTLSWIHFSGLSMSEIYKYYIQRGGECHFHSNRLEDYLILHREINEIALSSSDIKDLKIYEKLVALLYLLFEDSTSPKTLSKISHKSYNMEEIKDYIDNHYNNKITLDLLSDTFYINKFYLTRCFKREYRYSIIDYLSSVRITQAKQLLLSNLSIKTIAKECGFTDANYFSRLFHKIEGISPKEFRSQWIEKSRPDKM